MQGNMLRDCVKTEQSTGATVRCFPSKLGGKGSSKLGRRLSARTALWARPDLLTWHASQVVEVILTREVPTFINVGRFIV